MKSGWCGQHGRPDHAGCRSVRCDCWCHPDAAEVRLMDAELAQQSQKRGAMVTLAAVDSWEDMRAAETANEAARPRRKTGPDLPTSRLDREGRESV